MEFEKKLNVTHTGIPGLLVVDMPVHGDNRGWFKENWQRAKMTALGVPDLRIVQNNVSFNAARGVTRGLHAEPWDKFISAASGEIFGAWVDLREGPTFGQVFTTRVDASRAVYVPRGVANGFQALADGTVYTYLVDAHWSLERKREYTFVNLADPTLAISWPIPLDQCELSDADRAHPMLADVTPMPSRKTLVTGADGQLGQAVRAYVRAHDLTGFTFTDRSEFDFSDPGAYDRVDWDSYGVIINAGAYTAVDRAQTPQGRAAAWRANALGPSLLARTAREHDLTLVHVSSDYVFDGSRARHDESEAFSPLGVYGQSKAAGDLAVAGAPRHYILRSSWVIGEGRNFVGSMLALAARVSDPGDALEQVTVVDDQVGRLTFTDDMAGAVMHLLDTHAPYGVYDMTGSGEEASWYQIARRVFERAGADPDAVRPVSTSEYYAHATGPVAPRPAHSTLDLTKIEKTGYQPNDWQDSLTQYVTTLRRDLEVK